MDTLRPVDQFTSILPSEIVEYIFLLCCTPLKWGADTYDQHSPSTNVPLLLSHVSETWREIVHATPALWTDVCCHTRSPHPELWKQILHYSENCPLTVCVVMSGEGAERMEWLNICMKGLCCHSDRIRSFRLLGRYSASLWGEDVPLPPFPRLEDLQILAAISEDANACFYHLFDSPQLRKVTWLSQARFPESLMRVGTQIKELVVHNPTYVRIAAVLQACPNLTYLDASPSEPYYPSPNYPIRLQDLHTLRSNELGVALINAPNLRHLTLALKGRPGGGLCEMIHLPRFLSLSLQIVHLHLDIIWQSPGVISQIAPLTPCLVILELGLAFWSFPDAFTIDAIFEIFTHDGASALGLPRLQHLRLDLWMTFGIGGPPPLMPYDAEKLLHMLESRCNPNLYQTRLDGSSTVAVLKSCTMNMRNFQGDPPRAADAERRLKMLKGTGLVLEGNMFTPS